MQRGAAAVADPLFVGGTGRSGTHAVAKLLGRHSRYHYVSRELRFHTDRGGLPDLLSGRIDLGRFIRNMREYYWRRRGADGRPRGLHSKFKRRVFERALTDFERSYPDDPLGASRDLIAALLDPMAEAAGKPAWIEQTPQTAAAAPTLLGLFSEMRLIHMVRDGRDVASSISSLWWGPNSFRGGLRWWERRLREAHAGAAALPPGRALRVELEGLVAIDRDASYRRLLEFLAIEDEARMRRHFDKKLTAENANLGRWRQGLSERRQRRITKAYARRLERLHADGVSSAPDPSMVEP